MFQLPMSMSYGILGVVTGLSILFLGFALDIMGLFSHKNHFQVDGRTVVITGGSQGMGLAVAKLLALKGANVVIVARNKDKLATALESIKAVAKRPSQKFHWISADVTDANENIRLLDEVVAWNDDQPPDIVWAIAGFSTPGLFIDTPIETLRAQMDTNYWSAAYLAHATLKLFLRPMSDKTTPGTPTPSKLPRHFIMTSSVIAFLGIADYTLYAPAKSAMRGLADCLRSEMNLYNGARRRNPSTGAASDVKIHIVFPGTILSPGLEEEEKTKHPATKIVEEGDVKQTPEQVASMSVRALERGHYLITTQIVAAAMKASMLGGSARNNWFLDTLMAWAASIILLFVGPDLEAKVFNYGKKHGVSNSPT